MKIDVAHLVSTPGASAVTVLLDQIWAVAQILGWDGGAGSFPGLTGRQAGLVHEPSAPDLGLRGFLAQPRLRGYVGTCRFAQTLRRRSVITIVSSPWRFCVSDTPWLRHLVVARTGTLWPNGTSHTPDSCLHPWRYINIFFAATRRFLHAGRPPLYL